ncbi:MAG: tyrosine-type recombinase/integrase [Promethearchaeota archaeon]
MNKDVQMWISNKIKQYAQYGKDINKFNITSYLNALQKFCDFYKCYNPSDLLQEDADTRNKRLMDYLYYLLRNNTNEASVKNAYQSRIRSFYSDRGAPITIGLKSLKSGINKNEIILDKYTIKRIQVRLERPEYRLILKLQTLLGLRISDVLDELTSGKYIIEKYKDHYFIRNFTTAKENVRINYLFFPRELTTLFQSIYGKDLTQLDLRKILMTNRKEQPSRIKKYDYLRRIKIITEKLGIEKNIKTHSFRKYFSSQIRRCTDVSIEFKEHLMGHELHNLGRAYNQNLSDIHWFYNTWRKIEKYICIDTEIYDETNLEINRLKEENIKLKKKIKTLLKNNIRLEKKIANLNLRLKFLDKIIEKIYERMDIDSFLRKSYLEE